ncbi:MAG: NAD(+) diphosphatase [Pseudomonadota bacterium]
MAHDLSAHIPFNMGGLERCERERTNALWLIEQMESPKARFVGLHNLKVAMLTHPSLSPAYLKSAEVPIALENNMTTLFLGLKGDTPVFAIDVLDQEAAQLQDVGYSFIDVRTIAMQMHGPDLAIIGHARSMMSWHLKNRYCGNCGTRTLILKGGALRKCTNDDCAMEYYPRNDPVVIMLAHKGEKCLLGRQHRFPPKMYSALAGFLEHGESLEEAVRRELHEEAGIHSSRVDYVSSQAWPFEHSIMIACLAEAAEDMLNIDKEELDDARWVSVEDARAALAGDPEAPIAVPPDMAIAHHLVRHWVESFDDSQKK